MKATAFQKAANQREVQGSTIHKFPSEWLF